MAHKKPSDEVQKLLKTVFDHFDQEDSSVREYQLRQWKKLKCYWDSLFRIYWSSTAHDYRTYDLDNSNGDDNTDNAYDKFGCRCNECKLARSVKNKKRIRK